MIFIQPDLPDHKLESGRSFRVPECCAAWVRLLEDSGYCRVWKEVFCCESNEESPESQWLFGAGLGARSPQRTPCGIISNAQITSPEEHDRLAIRLRRMASALRVTANGYGFCLRLVLPPGGFPVASWTSSASPSRSPQETHKPKVTPQSPITARHMRTL